MKVITLSNQKGGCGKTTTAQTLAIGLVNRGYKVLAIDADPQCNLSSVFGLMSQKKTKGTLLDVMKQDLSIKSCAFPVRIGLDVLASNPDLNKADKEFAEIGDSVILNDALEEVTDYDFVVVDTPPNMGALTTNALMASDFCIVPMTPDYFSIQGLQQLNRQVQIVKRFGSSVEVLGILLTRCDRTNLSNIITNDIKKAAETLGTTVFNSCISQAVAIRESQLIQSDIYASSPKSKVVQEYDLFIDECIQRIKEGN